ncbi:MAG: silent information regulator protein Sir2 [Eubacteriales bacterium]|nr:silent information regulator protein Sir2 [Eubacteriales bacterium]
MKAIISKAAQRKWAWILALVMIVSIVIPTSLLTAKADVGTVKFIDGAAGWLESAYAQWSIDNEADGYTAYIKKASQPDSAYARIDNELIRKYKSFYRVDVVGLAEGDYVIKVVPVKNGKEVTAKAQVTKTLNVSSYDRSGFAFSSESKYKTGSGAYNEDGTLKSDAIVLYVTNDNAKTITASVKEAKGEKEYTGLQTIIDAYTKSASKGIETRALDVRVIGCLTDAGMDKFSSSAEGVQIKGASAYSKLNMTIEGIGADATINGFGFLLRNAGNVEMRNLSIINFMDDGISLDTANCNVWIHNVDLYYGKVGGDADQAKGDGSIDIKGDSQYITVSYVHFYDSGKCSLCGMKSESGPNYITYHHNWFDHSDSRHARVRTMSVHLYNNYYDGNAKYGAGSTMGSSLFVQNNYFRNCKNPMLSSNQGTDALGEGTFSGENGGIIKAYGNVIVGAQKIIYANAVSETGDSANATSFDAYLAKSANEKVPSSYKTVAGGTSYDNFDTTKDLGVKSGSLNDAKDVPSVVTSAKGAGSLGGGVIPWTFSDKDDSVYAVDKELKTAVTNYKNTDLVSVGGTNAVIVSPDPSTEETKATESTTKATQATTKATESTTKATEKETTGSDTTTSYDKTSLAYSGAYTDISRKKDSDFKNAKYVSSSNEILNAISSAKAGDVIIVKEGTYKFSDTIVINNTMNGKSGSYIIVKAEDGKEVKFDFSAQKLDGANRGVVVDGDYWYFQGINFYGAGDNGVLLAGNNNIFEKCVFEANRDSGLQISRYDTTAATKDLWPSNNLIINCTSHDNCDFPDQGGTGENADGFAAKLTCGEGNVFDGCISYSNSDDGWDLFAKSATGPIGVVTIRNCVAFNNGTLSNGVHYANGDMNGFKLGGSGVGTPHNVMNCLSFDNGATGFTDNNNPTGLTIVNVTAWGNGKYAKKGNFLCYRTSSDAMFKGLVSAGAIDSDKFTGKMADSIYYNSGKYYNLSGSLFTSLVSGDKKGTVVTDPAKTAGMFKNTVNAIDMSKNVDKQLRNADGTINMNSLYETTGSYVSMGARFNVSNQVISISSKNSSSEDVTKPEETTKAQETTKATESTTKATEATTKATEATSVSAKGEKLILNANDAATGKIKSSTVVDGLKIVATSKKTVTVDKSAKDYKNISFTKRIKLSGAGNESARAISFKTAGESKVKIYATSSDTDTSRLIKIIDKDGNDVTSTAKIPGSSLKSVSFRLDEAGEYYIVSEDGGVNIYYVEVSNGIAY